MDDYVYPKCDNDVMIGMVVQSKGFVQLTELFYLIRGFVFDREGCSGIDFL